MGRVNFKGKIVDNLGNVQGSDVLAGYKAADTDQNPGGTSYYGFTDTAGNWYIMKEVQTSMVYNYTFIAGTTNYSTNWTNRASLTYATYEATF